jgi:hypothetical protein
MTARMCWNGVRNFFSLGRHETTSASSDGKAEADPGADGM